VLAAWYRAERAPSRLRVKVHGPSVATLSLVVVVALVASIFTPW
jgi:hypothetical protein